MVLQFRRLSAANMTRHDAPCNAAGTQQGNNRWGMAVEIMAKSETRAGNSAYWLQGSFLEDWE
jgi:hypothetical protein